MHCLKNQVSRHVLLFNFPDDSRVYLQHNEIQTCRIRMKHFIR